MSAIVNLLRLLNRRGAEARVPLGWLLRSPSRVNARFARRAKVQMTRDGQDLLVKINGELYVWPADAPVDDLVAVVAELVLPQHPHQYLWGPTQIRAGDVVLDIGSCEGSFAALAVARGAQVVAVEPSERMQRIIRRLFQCRNLPPPTIVGCALGASAGQAALIESSQHPGYAYLSDAVGAGNVRVLTVDELVEILQLPRVDFIKCDAEGSDLDIIRGARQTLVRYRPRLAVCTYHADDHFLQLAEFLKELGYQVMGKGFMHTRRKFRVLMLHAW